MAVVASKSQPPFQQSQKRSRSEVLGFPADSVTMEDAVAAITSFVETRSPHLVVALNIPKMRKMASDARLREAVCSADLILPEKVVVLASRLCTDRLRQYIGNDRLTKLLLPIAAEKRYRLFFLGTRRERLQTLACNIRQQYPSIAIAGMHEGFFDDAASEPVVNAIRNSDADLLFVGMGTPRQEYWMSENASKLEVPVIIGVGGTLDLLAGCKAECPGWIRAAGAEWLFRLVEDPSGKATRYFGTLPWFLGRLVTHGIMPHRAEWRRSR